MTIIIAIILFYLVLRIIKPEKPSTYVTAVKDKCPPHQWYWQEMRDDTGEFQGERIVCKKCGPLSKMIDGSIE